MSDKSASRNFQLKVMGWLVFILPLLAIFLTMSIHDLPFPMSISETATIAWRVSFLLPMCIGAFALFSLTYCIHYSYDSLLEKVITAIMFVGFLLLAVQYTASPYIGVDRIGFFGLSQEWSHIVHCIGAVSGFGAAILWVLLCFTKSDKPISKQTARKRIRNSVYGWLGVLMIASLLLFVVDMFGAFGDNFPVVFVAEWVIMVLLWLALIIKGGSALRDKEADEG